ncbi:MAG: thioredoxin family protein [Duodenibacillus sp.]
MLIEVYGTGCVRCSALFDTVQTLCREEEIEADVRKVSDFPSMLRKGIMSLPAVAVDGDVKAVGRVPSREELLGWIKAAQA